MNALTTPKERPVLFNVPMVRALFRNKRQTRRPNGLGHLGAATFLDMKLVDGVWVARFDDAGTELWVKSPHGGAGDRLWVRETWYCDDYTAGDHEAACVGHVKCACTDESRIARWQKELFYRADAVRTGNVCELIAECQCDGRSPWKPSIHMPRWASRITLDITAVRVERLKAISEADAIAEGVTTEWTTEAGENFTCTAREAFTDLWCETYGDESWSANPWVWVTSFDSPEVREFDQVTP